MTAQCVFFPLTLEQLNKKLNIIAKANVTVTKIHNVVFWWIVI